MAKKNNEKSIIQQPITVSDPAPLGLIGLAVAALVLASTDLGLVPPAAKSLMIPWGFFLWCNSTTNRRDYRIQT